MIRRATIQDASRIAEILVFTKRMNYRRIFQNDQVSFGEIQVYPLARGYLENPERLSQIWVYDDAFVKGMLHIEDNQISELYVDSFFENQGIGGKLLQFAVREKHCRRLWVLEKNTDAIRFYEKHGFSLTGVRAPEAGTAEYIVEMALDRASSRRK
ncbi:MAG: GNAT family N-acetyltransferase [Bacteroidales bacterium]|nr:GNAT family N-acetyltransferase [Bacteroidales bacterium]MCM1416513.1 GNAT family N-acetyltransferase [bacterium]MCM1424491.1 GNAT family N-acetyltransferase [bacterium]